MWEFTIVEVRKCLRYEARGINQKYFEINSQITAISKRGFLLKRLTLSVPEGCIILRHLVVITEILHKFDKVIRDFVIEYPGSLTTGRM